MSDKEYALRPNKTQIKQELRVLNALAKELIALPEGTLKKIPLTERMYFEIKDGQRFSRGALQRQLRRIVKLMQYEDLDAINLELLKLTQPSKQQTAEFHQLEQWRDKLIAGDDKLLTELISRFSDVDRQYIRQLVRNAANELAKNKPPKSARSLYQYLSKLFNEEKLQLGLNGVN